MLVLAAGVSGALALLGVWIGKAWERRSAAENWRRDRRLEAYSRLVEVDWETWAAAAFMWPREDHQWSVREVDRMIEVQRALPYVVAQIELLGPDDVARAAEDAAMRLMEAALDLLRRFPTREADEPLGTPRMEAATKAHTAFLKAAQRALK